MTRVILQKVWATTATASTLPLQDFQAGCSSRRGWVPNPLTLLTSLILNIPNWWTMVACRGRNLQRFLKGRFQVPHSGLLVIQVYYSTGVESGFFQLSQLLRLFQHVPNPKGPGMPTAVHTPSCACVNLPEHLLLPGSIA